MTTDINQNAQRAAEILEQVRNNQWDASTIPAIPLAQVHATLAVQEQLQRIEYQLAQLGGYLSNLELSVKAPTEKQVRQAINEFVGRLPSTP